MYTEIPRIDAETRELITQHLKEKPYYVWYVYHYAVHNQVMGDALMVFRL